MLALSDTNVCIFNIVRSFCKDVLWAWSVADGVCESVAVSEITSREVKHFTEECLHTFPSMNIPWFHLGFYVK